MAASLEDGLRRAVRAERVRRGWSQAQLARRLGVSRSSVSAMECGQRVIQARELPGLCEAQGVDLDLLLVEVFEHERAALGLNPRQR